jgi:hypothetical protein
MEGEDDSYRDYERMDKWMERRSGVGEWSTFATHSPDPLPTPVLPSEGGSPPGTL